MIIAMNQTVHSPLFLPIFLTKQLKYLELYKKTNPQTEFTFPHMSYNFELPVPNIGFGLSSGPIFRSDRIDSDGFCAKRFGRVVNE